MFDMWFMIRSMDATDIGVVLTGLAACIALYEAVTAKRLAKEANKLSEDANKISSSQARKDEIRRAKQEHKLYVEAHGKNAFKVINCLDVDLSALTVCSYDLEYSEVVTRYVKPGQENIFKLTTALVEENGKIPKYRLPIKLSWVEQGSEDRHELVLQPTVIWPED